MTRIATEKQIEYVNSLLAPHRHDDDYPVNQYIMARVNFDGLGSRTASKIMWELKTTADAEATLLFEFADSVGLASDLEDVTLYMIRKFGQEWWDSLSNRQRKNNTMRTLRQLNEGDLMGIFTGEIPIPRNEIVVQYNLNNETTTVAIPAAELPAEINELYTKFYDRYDKAITLGEVNWHVYHDDPEPFIWPTSVHTNPALKPNYIVMPSPLTREEIKIGLAMMYGQLKQGREGYVRFYGECQVRQSNFYRGGD